MVTLGKDFMRKWCDAGDGNDDSGGRSAGDDSGDGDGGERGSRGECHTALHHSAAQCPGEGSNWGQRAASGRVRRWSPPPVAAASPSNFPSLDA